jgi:choline kinase
MTTQVGQTPRLAVVLGAGRGQSATPTPAALEIVSGDTTSLDWTVQALAASGVEKVKYVAGFRAEEVLRRYPDLEVVVNPHWETTHTLGSLRLVTPLPDGEVILQYADTLFRQGVYEQLLASEADVVCAYDSRFRSRLASDQARQRAEKVVVTAGRVVRAGRRDLPAGQAHGQLTGLVLLRGAAIDRANAFFESLPDSSTGGSLTDLLQHLLNLRIEVTGFDAAEHWAELDTPEDLPRFVFGTKGRTLERLSQVVTASIVDPFVIVDAAHWPQDRDAIMARIAEELGGRPIIARSSARAEDGWAESGAGAFSSVGNLDPADANAVAAAIDEVFASFPSRAPGNEVLVQRYLDQVEISGVLFTRNANTAGPYYVVNYAAGRLGTDAVTAGRTSDLKTVVVARWAAHDAPADVAPVLNAMAEVERLVGYDALDIEFAVDRDGFVHLLQVRPLVGCLERRSVLDREVREELSHATRQVEAALRGAAGVAGARGILANMPDWNPAEIIGVMPSPMAASIYHELVTGEVWAASRAALGYRDVRPRPLMSLIAGRPYIDVRASFNSFLPADLSPSVGARLVDHYLDRLRKHPELHDKVEFEIVFSCLTFDFDASSSRLAAAGLDAAEIEELRAALGRLTAAVIGANGRGAAAALAQASRLEGEIPAPAAADDFEGLVDRIWCLADLIRRKGTLPFANLARQAFIATAMLRSLVARGLWTAEQLEGFLLSIDTVAGQFARDTERLHGGELKQAEFLRRYGHLRPGTYDLCVPSLAEAPELYLRSNGARSAGPPQAATTWSRTAGQMERLAEALREAGAPCSADEFLDFCRAAIEGRELAKFEFTKALSAMLGDLGAVGRLLGLAPEELSLLKLQDIAQLRVHGWRTHEVEALRAIVERRRGQQALTATAMLPHMIGDPIDLFVFEVPASHPNFVTHKTAVGPLVPLGAATGGADLTGAIVMFTNADPGYDWIFSRPIAGLITVYGGANSHMAIRCAEFGLPAAIGVGERLAEGLESARIVCLDCAGRQVNKIS